MPDEYDVKDEHRETQDDGGEEEEVRHDSIAAYAVHDRSFTQIDMG